MKYSLKGIMNRAWEIKRQNRDNDFGLCLRMAWEEAKTTKTHFTGYAVEQKVGYSYNMVFKTWSNYGKSRVYITREGYTDAIGYIDLDSMRFVAKKPAWNSFGEDADNFLRKYEVA